MEERFFEKEAGETPMTGNWPEVLPNIELIKPKIANIRENLGIDCDPRKTEQNTAEFLLMQQIDAKVGETDINEKNYSMFSESLVREFGVENNDKIKAYIFAFAGIKVQGEREKRRFDKKDNRIDEKIKYKQNIGDFIIEWRKEPEIIKKFWQDMQKEYESDACEQAFKGFKYGILAELAAKNASETALKNLDTENFGIKKYEIGNGSIKADKNKAIDFFITFCYFNDRVEKIPCQVKAFDISVGSEAQIKEKIKFCEEKMVNFINSNRSKDLTENYYYTGIEKKARQKTEKLRSEGFPWANTHNGIMFFIPADAEILKDDGTLNDEYEKAFEKKFIEQFDRYFPSVGKH